MASGEIDQKWCHLHSQLAEKCRYPLCQLRANDPEYANFANEDLLNTTTGMGTMEEGMAGLHELYLSHKSAGFTQAQALWLIGAMIASNPGPPPPDEP